MRKRSLFLVLVLVWMVAACATLQQKYDKATPQEKSQIWISQFQTTLQSALNLGGEYVDRNPQYRPVWKEKGLSTARVAQGLLDSFTKDLESGKAVSVSTIIAAVGGKIGEIVALVQSWGVKVSSYDELLLLTILEGGEA